MSLGFATLAACLGSSVQPLKGCHIEGETGLTPDRHSHSTNQRRTDLGLVKRRLQLGQGGEQGVQMKRGIPIGAAFSIESRGARVRKKSSVSSKCWRNTRRISANWATRSSMVVGLTHVFSISSSSPGLARKAFIRSILLVFFSRGMFPANPSSGWEVAAGAQPCFGVMFRALSWL